MTEQHQADILLAKIERLEKDSRRNRWVGGASICALAAMIVFLLLSGNGKTASAREFLLKDQTGAITAKLSNGDAGPCLELMGKNGSIGALLCAYRDNGSLLDLRADSGESRVLLSPGGPLLDSSIAYAQGEVIRSTETVGWVYPHMTLLSHKDFVTATLGRDSEFRIKNGLSEIALTASGKPQINVVGAAGEPIWKSP